MLSIYSAIPSGYFAEYPFGFPVGVPLLKPYRLFAPLTMLSVNTMPYFLSKPCWLIRIVNSFVVRPAVFSRIQSTTSTGHFHIRQIPPRTSSISGTVFFLSYPYSSMCCIAFSWSSPVLMICSPTFAIASDRLISASSSSPFKSSSPNFSSWANRWLFKSPSVFFTTYDTPSASDNPGNCCIRKFFIFSASSGGSISGPLWMPKRTSPAIVHPWISAPYR